MEVSVAMKASMAVEEVELEWGELSMLLTELSR